eukprot:sb/3460824/
MQGYDRREYLGTDPPPQHQEHDRYRDEQYMREDPREYQQQPREYHPHAGDRSASPLSRVNGRRSRENSGQTIVVKGGRSGENRNSRRKNRQPKRQKSGEERVLHSAEWYERYHFVSEGDQSSAKSADPNKKSMMLSHSKPDPSRMMLSHSKPDPSRIFSGTPSVPTNAQLKDMIQATKAGSSPQQSSVFSGRLGPAQVRNSPVQGRNSPAQGRNSPGQPKQNQPQGKQTQNQSGQSPAAANSSGAQTKQPPAVTKAATAVQMIGPQAPLKSQVPPKKQPTVESKQTQQQKAGPSTQVAQQPSKQKPATTTPRQPMSMMANPLPPSSSTVSSLPSTTSSTSTTAASPAAASPAKTTQAVTSDEIAEMCISMTMGMKAPVSMATKGKTPVSAPVSKGKEPVIKTPIQPEVSIMPLTRSQKKKAAKRAKKNLPIKTIKPIIINHPNNTITLPPPPIQGEGKPITTLGKTTTVKLPPSMVLPPPLPPPAPVAGTSFDFIPAAPGIWPPPQPILPVTEEKPAEFDENFTRTPLGRPSKGRPLTPPLYQHTHATLASLVDRVMDVDKIRQCSEVVRDLVRVLPLKRGAEITWVDGGTIRRAMDQLGEHLEQRPQEVSPLQLTVTRHIPPPSRLGRKVVFREEDNDPRSIDSFLKDARYRGEEDPRRSYHHPGEVDHYPHHPHQQGYDRREYLGTDPPPQHQEHDRYRDEQYMREDPREYQQQPREYHPHAGDRSASPLSRVNGRRSRENSGQTIVVKGGRSGENRNSRRKNRQPKRQKSGEERVLHSAEWYERYHFVSEGDQSSAKSADPNKKSMMLSHSKPDPSRMMLSHSKPDPSRIFSGTPSVPTNAQLKDMIQATKAGSSPQQSSVFSGRLGPAQVRNSPVQGRNSPAQGRNSPGQPKQNQPQGKQTQNQSGQSPAAANSSGAQTKQPPAVTKAATAVQMIGPQAPLKSQVPPKKQPTVESKQTQQQKAGPSTQVAQQPSKQKPATTTPRQPMSMMANPLPPSSSTVSSLPSTTSSTSTTAASPAAASPAKTTQAVTSDEIAEMCISMTMGMKAPVSMATKGKTPVSAPVSKGKEPVIKTPIQPEVSIMPLTRSQKKKAAKRAKKNLPIKTIKPIIINHPNNTITLPPPPIQGEGKPITTLGKTTTVKLPPSMVLPPPLPPPAPVAGTSFDFIPAAPGIWPPPQPILPVTEEKPAEFDENFTRTPLGRPSKGRPLTPPLYQHTHATLASLVDRVMDVDKIRQCSEVVRDLVRVLPLKRGAEITWVDGGTIRRAMDQLGEHLEQMVQDDTRKLVQKCGFKAITANYIEDVKDSKCEVQHQPVVAYEDSGSGHVTGYQPIRDKYFLNPAAPLAHLSRMMLSQFLRDRIKQPIRTRYLGHLTGHQPIRDQLELTYFFSSCDTPGNAHEDGNTSNNETYNKGRVKSPYFRYVVGYSEMFMYLQNRAGSRDLLSPNQGPVFPNISPVKLCLVCFTAGMVCCTGCSPGKQPIRTRYLGHVTGYQPIRDHIHKKHTAIVHHTTPTNALWMCCEKGNIRVWHRPKQVNNQSELVIKVT